MPSRLKRYQTEGHDHFITFSCYHRLPYLNEDRARIVFEETLEKLRQHHQFFLFGYVLMPEHVHLLLSEPKAMPLATTLSALKGETSKKLKGERPQFWQTRYYDFNVLTHKKHVEKLRYIHRNPVERGLVDRPEDLAMEQLQPLRHRRTRPHGDRVQLDMESARTGIDPTHLDTAAMNGAPERLSLL